MTCVKFISGKEGLTGFELSGHSSESCSDTEGKIVCASVSSAAYMAANTVIEIIGDSCEAEVKEAFMKLRVKNPSERSRAVLEGFRLHITELSKQYSNRIRLEV